MAYTAAPDMRFRQKLAVQRTFDAGIETLRPAYPPPPPRYKLGTQRTYYENEFMYDVVIEDFHRRSKNGEIFNNSMYTESVKEDTPYASYVFEQYQSPKDTTTYTVEYVPWHPSLPKTMPDHQHLVDLAVTAAYANVSANEGNTLLWLGEFRETVSMLFDIGKGIKALVDATKHARKQWAKGQLTVEAQQKLTLSILYGILPLEESIAQFMEGLFRTKPDGRHTARGFQVKTETEDFTHDAKLPLWPTSQVIDRAYYTKTTETVVRAGVLTDIDYDGVPWLSVIADPKSVISTAYALARLSFVIDWFINVGNTLKAWTPSAGTTELSAWVTVEQTVSLTGITKCVLPSNNTTKNRASGSGKFNLEKRVKYRSPISRADLAIFPRYTLDLDLSKISAMVLLFAKVKK